MTRKKELVQQELTGFIFSSRKGGGLTVQLIGCEVRGFPVGKNYLLGFGQELFEIPGDEALEREAVARNIISCGWVDEFGDIDQFNESVEIDLGSGGVGEQILGELGCIPRYPDAKLDDGPIPEKLGNGGG